MTCTDAPEVSDGGRTSLAPMWSAGADQPPRAAAAVAVCRAGRGAGRGAGRRVRGIGRGDALTRGVGRGVAGAAVRVVSVGRGDEAVALGVGVGGGAETEVVGVGTLVGRTVAGRALAEAGDVAMVGDDPPLVA